MKIKVVLFAVARELAGEREVELDMPEAATVVELKQELTSRFPSLADLVTRSAFSVDHEFALDSDCLNENAEIALIPPVSGG